MQKFSACRKRDLADPAALLDQLGLHDRDLARGTAEGDEAELEPEAKRLGEGRMMGGSTRRHVAARLAVSLSGAQRSRRIPWHGAHFTTGFLDFARNDSGEWNRFVSRFSKQCLSCAREGAVEKASLSARVARARALH